MRDWGAQAQRLVGRRRRLITYRKVTKTTGPNPSTNPPNLAGSVSVNGNTLQGATSISLAVTKVNGNGYLKAGDTLVIAGDATTYTVGTDTANTGNGFAGVPISPALAKAASGGAAVTLTFAGDTTGVPAAMLGYPLAVVDGTAIIRGDMNVIIAAPDLPGITPADLDVLIDGATVRTIRSVSSGDAGTTAFWSLQAR